VFQGQVGIANNVDVRTLDEFEQTTAGGDTIIPDPTPVQRTIISLESQGSVLANVKSQGKSVLDLPDVHYMPTDELQLFVIPILTEITVDLEGEDDGQYTLDITQIDNGTEKKFTIQTTATGNTTDNLVLEDGELKFDDMEKDKTYNVTIGYTNTNTGEQSEFELKDVKTSDEVQKIAVEDWGKLDEADEKPVSFAQGDKEVKISEGTTGEELEEEFKEVDEEDDLNWGLLIGLLAVVIIGLLLAAAYSGMLPILVTKKKGLVILSCELSPEKPCVGETTDMRIVVRNTGDTLKAGEQEVLVAIFDGFDPIDELEVSDTDFETESKVELPAVKWTPETAGKRSVTIVVEIDGIEVEEYPFTVTVEE